MVIVIIKYYQTTYIREIFKKKHFKIINSYNQKIFTI